MFRSPACVDALEARIATNVTLSKNWKFFRVEAKGFSFFGSGSSPESAVANFLKRNGLSA